MKKFILALLFLVAASCANVKASETGPAELVGAPPEDAVHCAQALTLIDIRPEDELAVKAYTQRACEITDDAAELVLGTAEIKVIALPKDEVIGICSRGDDIALACTWKSGLRDGAYTIMIPHGSPGSMMHEVIHIILWEAGIPGPFHHPIMAQRGWYYPDRVEN